MTLTVRRIVETVAEIHQVPVSDLLSDRRLLPLAGARQEAMYLARTRTLQSLPSIGRLLRRTPSTVRHGVLTIQEMVAAGAPPATLTMAEAALDLIEAAAEIGGATEREIDPVVVAARILSSTYASLLVSIDEMRALAEAVLHASEAEPALSLPQTLPAPSEPETEDKAAEDEAANSTSTAEPIREVVYVDCPVIPSRLTSAIRQLDRARTTFAEARFGPDMTMATVRLQAAAAAVCLAYQERYSS